MNGYFGEIIITAIVMAIVVVIVALIAYNTTPKSWVAEVNGMNVEEFTSYEKCTEYQIRLKGLNSSAKTIKYSCSLKGDESGKSTTTINIENGVEK